MKKYIALTLTILTLTLFFSTHTININISIERRDTETAEAATKKAAPKKTPTKQKTKSSTNNWQMSVSETDIEKRLSKCERDIKNHWSVVVELIKMTQGPSVNDYSDVSVSSLERRLSQLEFKVNYISSRMPY